MKLAPSTALRPNSGLPANFTRGRKFSSDELQLMLLALLEQHSSHGYELVKEFHRLSGGYWQPSPGVIYPALIRLQELGYASVKTDSNKKSYTLQAAGHARLAAYRAEAEELLAVLAHLRHKMQYIQNAMAANPDAADEGGWIPDFVNARLALKRTLLRKSSASKAEQQRIAAILDDATRRINQPDAAT